MKKLFVFAFAAAAMVGCNSENGEGPNVPGQSDELRVLTSVSTQTRTAVDGTGFPKGSYIGVQVTQKNDDTQLLSGGTGNGTYLYYSNGKNIRFGNEAGVNNWASIDEDNKTHLFILEGTSVGKVRGYYPYTAALEGVGADDNTGAKIPVQIQKTGAIIAVDEPGQGTGDSDSKLAATSENEIDYMFDATTTDNGNNEVSAASTTTAKLVLKHALARVSFRMYASANAQQAVAGDADSYYEFVGYTIKNKSGATEFCANYDENTKMKIADGKLEGVLSGGEIARTISNYKLVKSETDNETANKAAADASLRVSNLVFPHETITADDDNAQMSKNIEVVFQLARVKGDGTKGESFGYALPFAIITGQSDSWEAGKNYTYTVKFTGNALSIETVTVTDWVEVVGGDMEIE